MKTQDAESDREREVVELLADYSSGNGNISSANVFYAANELLNLLGNARSELGILKSRAAQFESTVLATVAERNTACARVKELEVQLVAILDGR